MLHLPPRIGRIVAVYRAESQEPAKLVRYLVRRTKIGQFLLVVSLQCIGTNQKNHPNLYLYLVRRTKSCVSVLTLSPSIKGRVRRRGNSGVEVRGLHEDLLQPREGRRVADLRRRVGVGAQVQGMRFNQPSCFERTFVL